VVKRNLEKMSREKAVSGCYSAHRATTLLACFTDGRRPSPPPTHASTRSSRRGVFEQELAQREAVTSSIKKRHRRSGSPFPFSAPAPTSSPHREIRPPHRVSLHLLLPVALPRSFASTQPPRHASRPAEPLHATIFSRAGRRATAHPAIVARPFRWTSSPAISFICLALSC
jgi:hypothetical protein